MELFRNIGIGLAVLVVTYLSRRPILRFIGEVIATVRGKAIALVSAVIFVILLGLVVDLFGKSL